MAKPLFLTLFLVAACLDTTLAEDKAAEVDLPTPELASMLMTKEDIEKAKLKGNFETAKTYGTFTYVTGDKSASKAIIYVYDQNGFSEKTLQNADLLASEGGFLVIMPDVGLMVPAKLSSPSSLITIIKDWFMSKLCRKKPCSIWCYKYYCKKPSPPPPPPPPPPETTQPPTTTTPQTTTPAPPPPPSPPPPAPPGDCTCTCEGDPDYSWVSDKCPAPKARALPFGARTSGTCNTEKDNPADDHTEPEELEKVLPKLPANVVQSLGIFGSGLGAQHVVQISALLKDKFKAGFIVDPPELEPAAACYASFPMFVAWAGAGNDQTPFYNVLAEKYPEDKLGKQNYPSAQPDFFGSNADLSNEENKKAITDIVAKAKEYFLKNL